VSEPAAKVQAIKPVVNEKLVECLESWLADAKRGELIGAVLLGNLRGEDVQHSWVGEMKLSVAMVTFEQMKLKALGVLRED
jgi:hypothetical protein